MGADHPVLIGLCDHFGLKLEDNTFSTQAIYNGTHYRDVKQLTDHNWEQKLTGILDRYKHMEPHAQEALDRKLDKTDWWRYLLENGCPERDLELRDLIDSTDFGESIRGVSALAAVDEYSSDKLSTHNQMDLKIKGGNSSLALALSKLFADKIRMGTKVERVVQTTKPAGKVKVYCSDGYVAEGDKLICTAPAFAVSKIKWEPELPAGMQMALQGLEYARINKNAILYRERFWERDDFDMITDMPGHYFYHATKNQTSLTDAGVLISYTIGDKAAVIASQQDDERVDLADQSLKTAFPYTKSLAGDQLDYYWGNDKYSRGAYAVYGKGQWFDLFPKLNAPHIHTHFAGEHLSEPWGGFMEGALETGRDAAGKI